MDTKPNQYLQRFHIWRAGRMIDAALLLDYRRDLEQYPAPSSRNRHIQALLPWLYEQRLRGYVTMIEDDMRRALARFREPTLEPDVLTAGQVHALVNVALNAERDLARFVLLGLVTGARPGELVAIQGKHFNGEALSIWAPKTQRARRVPFKYSSVLTTLAPLVRDRGKLMEFTGPRGMPRTRPWRKLCNAAGLGIIEPRIMRRSCASFVASSGKIPPVWLSEWFGHSAQTAWRFYQLAQGQAEGNTVEEWYGCPEAFKALLEHCQPSKAPESAA